MAVVRKNTKRLDLGLFCLALVVMVSSTDRGHAEQSQSRYAVADSTLRPTVEQPHARFALVANLRAVESSADPYARFRAVAQVTGAGACAGGDAIFTSGFE